MFEMPPNEAERLADLVNYGILDTAFEDSFDRITRLAAFIFGAPISAISLIDRDRQWFKSAVGLGVRQTPRDVAFCNTVVCDAAVLVVPDARDDARFANNPFVVEGPKIRFYAGAPLINAQGHALGSVCVIDDKPRAALKGDEIRALEDFAGLVIDLMEARKAGRLGSRAAAKH